MVTWWSASGSSVQKSPADVAFGVGGASLTGHGGEADKDFRLFSDLREDGGTGVGSDVVGYGELAECSRTLGVHASFGDDFTVEVGQFLQEPYVL